MSSSRQATFLFTREVDLLQLEKWEYKVEDKSVTTRLYTPIWNTLVKLIPKSVAPNVITLTALVCILQAFWIAYKFSSNELHHDYACYCAAFLIYAHMMLDALDGLHARNTLNSSPLGEFFDHGCDNVSNTFLVLTVLMLVGVEDKDTLWYLVQTFQLISLTVHIRAFNDSERKIRFGFLTGPGELLHAFIILLTTTGWLGKERMWELVKTKVLWFYDEYFDCYLNETSFVPPNKDDNEKALFLVSHMALLLYVITVMSLLVQVLLINEKYFATKFGFLLSLCMRVVPAFLYATQLENMTLEKIMTDGLFVSIICSDVIVAKMTNRDLHSLVPVIAMMSVVSGIVISAGAVALYHCTVIFDMCTFLGLPILNPVINVYCDGVFDLLHLGHKRQFEKALKGSNGTRLFVGVLSDKASTEYKRRPILSENERYDSVAACKYVHKVIKDAPLITDEKFIKEHQIHIFAVGEEYVDDPEDEFYAVPRKLGILRATSRTPGISTSELIRRIANRDKEELGRAAPAKQGI